MAQHQKASLGREPPRWRSRGWVPLAYPRTCLVRGDEPNRFFPLQRHVLAACVRELLLLEGTLHKTTLSVVVVDAKSNDPRSLNPTARYRLHMDDMKTDNEQGERQMRPSSSMTRVRGTKRKKGGQHGKKKKQKQTIDTSTEDEEHTMTDLVEDASAPTAEELVKVIVARSLGGRVSPLLPDPSLSSPPERQQGNRVSLMTPGASPPPRKVSDVDQLTTIKDCNLDVLRFWSFTLEKDHELHSGIPVPWSQVPDFLEASISSETTLRSISLQMTECLVSSFSDTTLGRFLGYKTPALDREKLLRVLADYLFDTCHAMFAWKQTELELVKSGHCGDHDQADDFDDTIREILFDSRALRKIGGFEPFSLLPHALSIDRLERDGVSWRDFAESAKGKKLLEHHFDVEKLIDAGQRRRGQRLRQRQGSTTVVHEQRSRSSSLTSSSEVTEAGIGNDSFDESCGPAMIQVPSALEIFLSREEHSSWGVLLAKEGDLCVVVRASPGDGGSQQLSVGDLILSAVNERGEHASSPYFQPSLGKDTVDDNWFQSLVRIFKAGRELKLVVQRVGH